MSNFKRNISIMPLCFDMSFHILLKALCEIQFKNVKQDKGAIRKRQMHVLMDEMWIGMGSKDEFFKRKIRSENLNEIVEKFSNHYRNKSPRKLSKLDGRKEISSLNFIPFSIALSSNRLDKLLCYCFKMHIKQT
jgi:hypothetical protein